MKYKKRADGYYATTVWDGTYDDAGHKRRRTLYAKTVRDLDAKVRDIAQSVEDGRMVIRDGRLWIAYCREWYDTRKASASSATQEMYRGVINRYLAIEDRVLLADFGPVHLARILAAADGRPETQRKIVLTLKQIIQAAVSERRYSSTAKDALFAAIPQIRHAPAEKRPLTAAEKEAVFKADLPPIEKTFLFLIYGCGLRREEALALTTRDVTITDTAGHVAITKARALTGGKTYATKEPKTARGTRTVPIPRSVRKGIQDYVSTLDPGADLFPEIAKNKYDVMWRHIVKALQDASPEPIEGLTAHIFRHNFVTDLCYQIPRVSLKNVARIAGDTEAVILKVYDHLDLMREDAASVMDDAF